MSIPKLLRLAGESADEVAAIALKVEPSKPELRALFRHLATFCFILANKIDANDTTKHD